MEFIENIIPQAYHWLEAGHATALVTLVNIEGSSPRPRGSQMAVTKNGDYIGMISGGCAEQAIITEAIDCLQKDDNRSIRYGAGSPYFDVKLPCGSGIDIYIETQQAAAHIKDAFAAQQKRQTITLPITEDYHKTYLPPFHIHAFGRGVNLTAFATATQAAGFTLFAATPDADIQTTIQNIGGTCRLITHLDKHPPAQFDAHSAVVTLFHEHEWEVDILHAALQSDCAYIGALGSRNTHQERLQLLTQRANMKRPPKIIKGPVGLEIGAQNPRQIAIAIIAEIIATINTAS